jgi:voltage-gated sodium channel
MVAWCRRTADSRLFQNVVLAVIIFNAALMGLETSSVVVARREPLFHALNLTVQTIFVIEIAIRVTAFWPRLHAFFRDGWNTFDFAIVAASLLPQSGAFAAVARLARLMRAARLASRVSELRLIIGTMLRSLPSMGHVLLLLVLLLYVYAILGFHFFRASDPDHFGSLGAALLTLFQVVTLEGWVEIQDASMVAVRWAWLYHASFILLAVFIVINLFIAIVINNLEATKQAERDAELLGKKGDVIRQVVALRDQVDALERALRRPTNPQA